MQLDFDDDIQEKDEVPQVSTPLQQGVMKKNAKHK